MPQTPYQQCGYKMLRDHLHTCYVIIFLGH